ncbi:ABC transporter substrate-binding protein [Flexithrix dorotheae]|uniref:ABC transporter substrate-binding protein n=1 Tax=Flexithrix dorotheae TaxID=70993 RepID=UPI00036E73A5|nr:ABC transporter substrate-binding protein [Flexithrix dorotheae]
MIKRILLIAVLGLISSLVLGQSKTSKALYKKYEYGKTFLNNHQYGQAKEVFKSVAAVQEGNSYRDYALYLYAYSAYKNGNKSESRDALFELIRKNPTWENMDDVNFLVGLIEFDNNSFNSGLEYFNKIKGTQYEEDINELLITRLDDQSIEELEFLYRKFEDDIIGEKIYKKLLTIQVYPTYQTLFEELSPLYGEVANSEDSLLVEPVYKDSYNVAVLLPFMEGDFTMDSIPVNVQRVLDLYEGIKIGAEKLKDQGIKLNLFAFDTKRDSLTTVKILSDPSFEEMDMIFGPLYPNTIPLVADYAGVFKKIIVNPVSSNKKFIAGNPFAFLTQATPSTEVKALADFAIDSLESKTAYILHGLKSSDERLAREYKEYLEERGGVVQLVQSFEYTPEFFENLLEKLGPLASDSVPHVFLSSVDKAVSVNAISALQSIKSRNPILVFNDLLEIEQLSYKQLELMKVFFSYPRYFDKDSIKAKMFQSDYVEKLNFIPSIYAYLGFESISLFGKMLQKYGTGLPNGIHDEQFIRGAVSYGFNFQDGNDNSFVPIVRLKNGILEIVNKPKERNILIGEK